MKQKEIKLTEVHSNLLSMMDEANREIDKLRYKLFEMSIKRKELQRYIDDVESQINCNDVMESHRLQSRIYYKRG